MADRKFDPTILQEVKGAVAILTTILLNPMLRRRYSRWGATSDEVNRRLPGDELVPHPMSETTRAITIYASMDKVWQWLVQLGYGRGGLYSYERLENLVGCNMRNADRIMLELQNLQVGDTVRLDPRIPLPYTVAAIVPGKSLVLHINVNPKTGKPFELTEPLPDTRENQTWVFYLDRIGERTTRLIIRSRHAYNPSFGNSLIWGTLIGPIHFVMEREMLRGIKRRAEATFQSFSISTCQ